MYRSVTKWAVTESLYVVFIGPAMTAGTHPAVVLKKRLSCRYAYWEVGVTTWACMSPEEG